MAKALEDIEAGWQTRLAQGSTVILTGAEKLRSSDGTGLEATPSNTNFFSAWSMRSTVDVPRSLSCSAIVRE